MIATDSERLRKLNNKIIAMSKKVKTLKEIAQEYGVCRNTLRTWIKHIEKKLKLSRRPLREWQYNMIYEFLDFPEKELISNE